jgi:hypothetical protein
MGIMKRKTRESKKASWHRLPMMVGMAMVMTIGVLYLAGACFAAEPAAKQAGKAPSEAAPAGKAAPTAVAKDAAKPAEKPAENFDSAPIVNPQADKLLREMGEYLKNAQQYSFQAEITFDDVLPSGQKIQFGATEDLAVRRPNGAYIEYRGDLGFKRFWYNGESVTLYDPDDNVYASEKVPAKIDEAMDGLMKEFGFSPPLVDLLYPDPYKLLIGKAQFGIYVGMSMIDGQRCHHLAFVDKYIDWQIWIEDGKQVVPRKILITYKTIPGAPQFTAVLSDWDFATRLPDTLFTASVPADAEKIQFVKLSESMQKK